MSKGFDRGYRVRNIDRGHPSAATNEMRDIHAVWPWRAADRGCTRDANRTSSMDLAGVNDYRE